jgi:hypothetical protein
VRSSKLPYKCVSYHDWFSKFSHRMLTAAATCAFYSTAGTAPSGKEITQVESKDAIDNPNAFTDENWEDEIIESLPINLH